MSVPVLWCALNALLVGLALAEYSGLQGAILNNIHSGRSQKYQVLHKQLVSKLSSKRITMGIYSLISATVLTLTGTYIGLALITIFISIIYVKIYSFN